MRVELPFGEKSTGALLACVSTCAEEPLPGVVLLLYLLSKVGVRVLFLEVMNLLLHGFNILLDLLPLVVVDCPLDLLLTFLVSHGVVISCVGVLSLGEHRYRW